jgi:hypothetical protein
MCLCGRHSNVQVQGTSSKHTKLFLFLLQIPKWHFSAKILTEHPRAKEWLNLTHMVHAAATTHCKLLSVWKHNQKWELREQKCMLSTECEKHHTLSSSVNYLSFTFSSRLSNHDYAQWRCWLLQVWILTTSHWIFVYSWDNWLMIWYETVYTNKYRQHRKRILDVFEIFILAISKQR